MGELFVTATFCVYTYKKMVKLHIIALNLFALSSAIFGYNADRKNRLFASAKARPEYQNLLKLKEEYHSLKPNCANDQKTEFVDKRWSNGDFYQGEWSNGKRNGLGFSYWADDDEIYVGEYKNDKENGKGFWMTIFRNEVEFPNEVEETYVGDFVDDQSVGYGQWEDSVGNNYKGEFANDQPDGLGKYWKSNSDWSYIGEVRNDAPFGFGRMMYHGKVKVGCWKGSKVSENKFVC